ncbi:MAG: hypothetical protein ACK522_08295 [Synechococcaceae cyanobacterium]
MVRPAAPALALLLAALTASAPGAAADGEAAPPLQTFSAQSAGLRGCFGLVRPRSPGRGSKPGEPLLAAWSLDGGWGVMRIQGKLQRFAVEPARRWRETGAAAATPTIWHLPWRVGRYSAELHFAADRLTPRRWGGDGRLQLRSLATGDLYTLPVRVEGGC